MAALIDTQTQKSDLAYVKAIMHMPLLNKDEEAALTKAWYEDRDEKAHHKIIQSYSRLVVSMAIRFRHYGLPLSDLIQEGTLGLLQASIRFEPNRDVRFATYAKWWIRSAMQDYILRNWSIVRTGSTSAQKTLFFNLKRLRVQLTDVTAEHMSQEEKERISKELHVAYKDVEEMENRLAIHDLSLSNTLGDDVAESWVDTLVDEHPTPEAVVIENHDAELRRNWIQDAIKTLTPREQTIILGRRLSQTPVTLEEMGKKLNISKERVRQLETKALRKMKIQMMCAIHLY